jgi:hypothetical protein
VKCLRVAIFACFVCLCFGRVGSAQNLVGSTTVDIDPDSGTVTATCETDADSGVQGYYIASVVCNVYDQNNNLIAEGSYMDTPQQGYAQVVLTFTGVPGNTYTAIGHHQVRTIVEDVIDSPPHQPSQAEYFDEFNFESFEGDPQIYPDDYDWDGPGPELDTIVRLIGTGETTETATDPQIPTASRIISTISSQAQSGCPAGYAGWNRSVLKIMTDQNGSDITTANQSLTEGVTISARNDLNLSTQPQTLTATTNGVGQFTDTLAFCSQFCPASTGETDATQVIGLTYQGQQHTLTPNAFVYKCTGNTINGN